MSEETKLCKDCRWYRRGDLRRFDICMNPRLTREDLVRGETTWAYCEVERQSRLRGCGSAGAWFESADQEVVKEPSHFTLKPDGSGEEFEPKGDSKR